MHKYVKSALVVGACVVLMGCPKVTAVTGIVALSSTGIQTPSLRVGDTLSAAAVYTVDTGASITIEYDNGKTCTFNSDFVPGNDGSVCEKQDDKKKDDKKDEKKDEKDQQQDQQQQDQQQGQSQQTQQGQQPGAQQNTGTSGTPSGGGGNPQGIGAPQPMATAAPSFSSQLASAIGNPIVQTTLSVVGVTAAVKVAYDQTNSDDKPVSK